MDIVINMLSQIAFSLGFFGGVSSSPTLSSRWTNGQVLNTSYLSPYFTQSRDNINTYIDYSVQSLTLGVNHTDGQFLDGTPNPVGNLFFWQSQNGWTGVARWDHQQNQRKYFIDVLSAQNGLARYPNDGFQQYGVPLVNTYNDDAGWAGMANVEAYEAYGHEIFLQRAIGIWEFISEHGFIDQGVLDQGYYEGVKYPNITLQSECEGGSMHGGVYWRNGGDPPEDAEISSAAQNPDVNAVSTGNFGLLGAELCRVTGDMKYCERSYENVWWMDRHMVDHESNLIWDHLNGTGCQLANWTFTYNIGLYFALHAELGHLTNNDTDIAIAEKFIVSALNTDQWNTPEGINMEGQGEAGLSDDVIGFKSIMIRYLNKAYYWIKDEDVKAAIVQYINIQYYALTHYAADSDIMPIRYARNWTGPAFNLSTQHAQVAAMDVLNGLSLNPDSAFPGGNDATQAVISVDNSTWQG